MEEDKEEMPVGGGETQNIVSKMGNTWETSEEVRTFVTTEVDLGIFTGDDVTEDDVVIVATYKGKSAAERRSEELQEREELLEELETAKQAKVWEERRRKALLRQLKKVERNILAKDLKNEEVDDLRGQLQADFSEHLELVECEKLILEQERKKREEARENRMEEARKKRMEETMKQMELFRALRQNALDAAGNRRQKAMDKAWKQRQRAMDAVMSRKQKASEEARKRNAPAVSTSSSGKAR